MEQIPAKRKLIWLDCDPGHDDFAAIFIAARDPNARLVGISACDGNTSIDHTARNALNILKLLGLEKEVPVVFGSRKQHVNTLVQAPRDAFHGETGLGGVDLEDCTDVAVIKDGAFEVWRNILLKHDKEGDKVHLVATGPLTNVALLFNLYPDVIGALAGVSIMGGNITIGNVTPAAEFNFLADPDAAQSVLHSGAAPIFLATLDLTHQVFMTYERIERLRSIAVRDGKVVNRIAFALMQSMKFFVDKYLEFSNEPLGPMHDPLAVYYVLYPQEIQCKTANVEIECASEFNYGKSVIDLHGRTDRPRNAIVGVKISEDRFFDYFFPLVEACPSVNA